MALRYDFPGRVGAYSLPEQFTIAPAMRPAVEVTMRRGADPDRIARLILEHPSVKLCAAVAAGKSTVIPTALARVAKAVVFHVTPGTNLARHINQYVTKQVDAGVLQSPELLLYTGDASAIPRIGVVNLGAAELVALMVQDPRFFENHKGCVVFLDEAHESDAYTHVVRNLTLARGAQHLVLASATFTASTFAKQESPSSVDRCTFGPDEVPESWNVYDRGRPWSAASVRNNLLVFCDSSSMARSLASEYRRCGFDAFRLTSRTSASEFDEAMVALNNRRGSMVALIVDYTYRSGFTFPVTTIIDTGRMTYVDPRPGVVAKCSRNIYRFEAEQAAGRGGRLGGMNATYYRPDVPLEPVVCSLEGVDMEAAALLYLMLGYTPSTELADTLVANYALPDGADLWSLINGSQPLSYHYMTSSGQLCAGVVPCDYSSMLRRGRTGRCDDKPRKDSLEPASSGVKVNDVRMHMASPERVTRVGKPEKVCARDRGVSVAASEVTDRTAPPVYSFQSRDSSVQPALGVPDDDAVADASANEQAWASFVQMLNGDGVRGIQSGKYYYCPQLDNLPKADYTIGLPRGISSLMAMLKSDTARVADLSYQDKCFALHKCLDRLNALNVDITARRNILEETFILPRMTLNDRSLRGVLMKAMEGLTEMDAERNAILRVLGKLSSKQFELVEFAGLPKSLQAREEYYRKLYADTVMAVTQKSDSRKYVADLEERMKLPTHKILVGGNPVNGEQRGIAASSPTSPTTITLPTWFGKLDLTSVDDGNGRGDLTHAHFRPKRFLRRISGVSSKECDHERGIMKTVHTDGRVVKRYDY